MTGSSHKIRSGQIVGLVLTMAMVLAGCGGGSAADSTTPTTLMPPPTSAPETTTLPPTTTTTQTTSTTTTVTTSTIPTTSTTSTPTTTTAALEPSTLVWRGPGSDRVVALTFDAGSDRGHAEEILDLLAANSIRVTFGMTGSWAEANPDLVRRMIDEGHTLMNHTYDHPHMETLTTKQRLEQLERTEAIIFDLTGTTTKPYFRPPYGSYNDGLLADVGAAGYRYSVMWTVDSLGWKGNSPGEVSDRCLTGVEPGAIILLHVGAASTDCAALPGIISGLVDAGYQFVAIPELFS